MNIVNNIWNKAPNPFKNDSQENDLTNNANQDQNTNPEDVTAEEDAGKDSSAFNIAGNVGNITGQVTNQVSGATNYVSNIFKSTFKGDSGESKSRKESLESTNENREGGSKKESLTSGASNLLSGVSNVWSKSTSIFNKQNEQQQQADDTAKAEDDQIQDDDEANLIDNNQKENVSQKAIDSAKNFGNLMFSFANKAGQTVSATAKQTTSFVKKTVENTNLFADFTKEQQEFIKEHGGNITIGEPPWVGCENEEEMKKQILSLSQDKRNFVRQPPSGVQFDFDLQQMLPVCLILLKEDENLNKMRFEIVPKLVNEDSFWRNYFYRVSLIKQSNSLNNMTCSKGGRQSSSESEGPDDIPDDNPEPEFVSDYLAQGSVTEEDVVSGMRAMGVSKTDSIKDDKKWEDELAKDLQEFEVVNKDCNDIKSTFDAELAKELDEIK